MQLIRTALQPLSCAHVERRITLSIRKVRRHHQKSELSKILFFFSDSVRFCIVHWVRTGLGVKHATETVVFLLHTHSFMPPAVWTREHNKTINRSWIDTRCSWHIQTQRIVVDLGCHRHSRCAHSAWDCDPYRSISIRVNETCHNVSPSLRPPTYKYRYVCSDTDDRDPLVARRSLKNTGKVPYTSVLTIHGQLQKSPDQPKVIQVGAGAECRKLYFI